MDFFNHIGYSYEEEFNRNKDDGRFLPVVLIKGYNPDLIDRITKIFINRCNLNIENEKDENNVYMLDYSLNEVIENIERHSETTLYGVVVVQPYPKIGMVDVCISDTGIGIPSALRKTDKYKRWTNEECLQNATKQNIKTEGYDNEGQGNGLFVLKNLIEESGGKLEIISDDAYYCYNSENKNINEKTQKNTCKWQGTIVKFEYSFKKAISIQKIFDDEGYEPYSVVLDKLKDQIDLINKKLKL